MVSSPSQPEKIGQALPAEASGTAHTPRDQPDPGTAEWPASYKQPHCLTVKTRGGSVYGFLGGRREAAAIFASFCVITLTWGS